MSGRGGGGSGGRGSVAAGSRTAGRVRSCGGGGWPQPDRPDSRSSGYSGEGPTRRCSPCSKIIVKEIQYINFSVSDPDPHKERLRKIKQT